MPRRIEAISPLRLDARADNIVRSIALNDFNRYL
jgi:hypothetical protein